MLSISLFNFEKSVADKSTIEYTKMFNLICCMLRALKQEVTIERIALFDEGGDPRIKEVTADDKEHSQWYDRNTAWLYSRA